MRVLGLFVAMLCVVTGLLVLGYCAVELARRPHLSPNSEPIYRLECYSTYCVRYPGGYITFYQDLQ